MPFARPTLRELILRADADLAAQITTGELAYSDRKVLARMHAGGLHGVYGHQAWLARQLVPSEQNDIEFLEKWCRLWLNPARKAATPARGTVTFTGVNDTEIPAGTELRREDGALFTTDEAGTIAAGEAEVAVTAVVAGAAGNTDPGESLSLVEPVEDVDAEVTVGEDGLTNGFDIETPAQMLFRLRQRLQNPPAGGAEHDYERWALEVPGVTRAWGLPLWMGAGSVGLTFVLDDQEGGILPDGAKVDEVEAYLLARAPADLHTLWVFAPELAPIDMTIALAPDTAAIRLAVEAELNAFFRVDAEPGKTVIRSKLSEVISRSEGENDHTLTVPAANVTIEANEIAVLGNITWT